MLLVYTHKITPRVIYTFKHICTRVLGIKVSFTSKVEDFVAHDGPKLSYTYKQLGNELHVSAVDLLFEQGVMDVDIQLQDWKGIPCFFASKVPNATIPYDIFGATFYMLSRYEEYLPHVKDALGRFPASESIAYKNNFLDRPVVDIWIQRFKEIVTMSFPEYTLKESQFLTQVIIDVPQAFAYRKVGFLRTVGGYANDFINFRLKRNFIRTQVLLGLRKDPFDIFSWLVNVQKQSLSQFKLFFELGDYTADSKNIKYSKRSFQSLIKMVGDYSNVGLLVSKNASQSIDVLKEEKKRIEHITNRPLKQTRITDCKIILPNSYRDLLDQEIVEDYTMGYPDIPGFRASTCTPFLFYDLDYEIQTPLMIYPFCIHINAIIDAHKQTIDSVRLERIKEAVKKVHGLFLIAFSNSDFTNVYSKKIFRTLLTTNE
ncbi:polysaccharide deacetylase family protein [uncultured Dokdonia sp.]|uniref:polysaccharide deacetylase family protein n=1 Tax=uncultured Dokdonia sp. TaxID=575653 RepID=UPI002627A291|nr:polysaccharide deacetylase family protein [uncultured Dokdonia sp.]